MLYNIFVASLISELKKPEHKKLGMHVGEIWAGAQTWADDIVDSPGARGRHMLDPPQPHTLQDIHVRLRRHPPQLVAQPLHSPLGAGSMHLTSKPGTELREVVPAERYFLSV
jgi:hypothetical protein